MPHNIPLMRKIHTLLTLNPDLHNQHKWSNCIAGWTIRLDGEYGLVYSGSGPWRDAVQCLDFRTGDLYDVEDIAAERLGLTTEEAAGMFGATNRLALDWLGDIIATHERRVFDAIAADLKGEVTA